MHCPGCDHYRLYGFGRTSRPHSIACRQSIMGELANSPEGQARISAASDRLDRTAFEMGRAQAQGEKDNASTAEPAIAEEVVPSAESTPPLFLPILIVVDDRDAPGAVDPVDHDQLIADGPYEAQEPELHQTKTEVDNSNDTHEPDAGGLDGGMDVDVVMQSGIPVDDCRSHADGTNSHMLPRALTSGSRSAREVETPRGELHSDGPRTEDTRAATAVETREGAQAFDCERGGGVLSGKGCATRPTGDTMKAEGKTLRREPYLSFGKPSFDASVFSISTPATESDTEMRRLLDNLTRDMREEVKDIDDEILSVVRSMAGNVGQYRRERRAALRAVVSEVYSPARTTTAIKLLPEFRLIPGFALDLTTVNEDDGQQSEC